LLVPSKRTLSQSLFLTLILASTFSALLVGGLWIVREYRRFNRDAEAMSRQYTEERKREMQQRVEEVVDFVEFKRRQTEQRIRGDLKEHVYEAHGIATQIYERYGHSRSLAEIQDMVRETLRSVHFNGGRGYYFATRLDGVEQLFTDRPEYEGMNLLDMQNTRGAYVVRDMIELVREQGEGYYSYTWTKPQAEGDEHLKLSFIKYFAPFDWFIGTGEYLEDVELEVQREVLEWIKQIRYGEDGYVFAGRWDGFILSGPETGRNMLDVTDAHGVKIVQQLIERARDNGGFVSYVMPKLEGQRPDPKISYAAGVEEWRWYIGTGLYLDDIEDAVAALRSERISELWWNIGKMSLVLVLLWFVAYVIFVKMTRKIGSAFAAFSSFFDEASVGSAEVPLTGLGFRDFRQLAVSANRMIARRRGAEKALRESETRFRELFENMSSGVAIYEAIDDGEDFVFKEINPAGERIGRLPRKQHLGRPVTEIYPGVKEMGLFAVLQEVWRTGKPRRLRMATYDDRRISLWVENYVCRLPTGEIVAVYEDVTEKKQAEMALRESEERSSGIIRSISDPMVMMDHHMKITWANENARNVFGDIVGKKCCSAFHQTKQGVCETCAVRDTLGDGRVHDQEIAVKDRSEKVRRFWCTAGVALRDDSNQPLMVVEILRDVTERHEAEQQRRQLEEQYRQAQKMEAIGQLTGGVAHDFNNLLQVINGYTAIAASGLGEDNPVRDSLAEVAKAGERAAELVSQLLMFSRRQVIRPEAVELNDVVAGMLNMLGRLIGEHIQIQWNPGPGGDTIFADRSMIEQALLNLCVNARDAMQEGGTMVIETGPALIDEEFCASRSWAKPGRYAVLRVCDTGCGMDKETLGHVFEPFFTTKSTGKGTGLGLATVYGIVKQHGGMIDIRSEPDQGSTFELFWPLSESQRRGSRTQADPAVSGGTETILLAEDDESVRSLGRLVLQQAGYTVIAASDGTEAVTLFEERGQEVDLVVLDLIMPKMGGREVYEELQKRRPGLAAVFTSGYSEKEIHSNFTRRVGVTLVQKPFHQRDLLLAVRNALDGRAP
jgi:two-component system cell cycle sensor histidine kinase/response regulator CckA